MISKKLETERKIHVISVRINAAEKEVLQELADNADMSLNKYLRSMIQKEISD